MLDFMVPVLVLLFFVIVVWRVWFVFNGWFHEHIKNIFGKNK